MAVLLLGHQRKRPAKRDPIRVLDRPFRRAFRGVVGGQ